MCLHMSRFIYNTSMRNKYPKIDTLNILVVAAAKDISFLLLKIHVGKKY